MKEIIKKGNDPNGTNSGGFHAKWEKPVCMVMYSNGNFGFVAMIDEDGR